jgi:NADH dehydrogenase
LKLADLKQVIPFRPDAGTFDNQLEKTEKVKTTPARVVVVGAGFGGLNVVRELANHSQVEVTVLDRNNYHGFWPLLYQVATAELLPDAIVFPVREAVHKYNNVRFQMAEVCDIDLDKKQVLTSQQSLTYDYLVLAAGSTNNYFGNQELPKNTFSLKDVDQAVALRRKLLAAFEQAVSEPEPAKRRTLLTFVIVGAGPTGVELAAAMAELVRPIINKYYPTLNSEEARIVLVEAHQRPLEEFPKNLQQKAQQHLKRLGVEVLTNSKVKSVENDTVTFEDGQTMQAATVVWAAGVRASTLAETLKVSLAHSSRVPVEPTLNLKTHPEVFVIGDMAYLQGYKGGKETYPGVAQVAIQMGKQAAHNILVQLDRQPAQPFHYFDKGSLATIGRKDAVADIFGWQLSGWLAWLVWLVVHLYFLVGVRNRLLVMLSWAYNYLTYNLGVRLVGSEKQAASTDF